ncbi:MULTISPECIES: maleylpyruvate isomerase family mycothiol-dependent enzyme [unclassified Streptomyces]|uniref:maleylpyruvate isomerase family mycothiol-dependent enzyme n=1 Tax=unclassified Streptomyces TaxID=2593676 RepID=UPI002DD9DF00|nr:MULTISPECIES: maleylpyruvate isomerase family mycothiol-dependent enzyme [unclassified Streptomyces]WSA93841.1 maleylpyruvate isomerase family mycothiol-dependent enzyme [Streptomyces sp. NBC_01795]WSS13533.1 maleylpyruvate isomerase family mycothiol-dependent enzyme [Streptomyces sp. NBC_01186]WSS42331.1 maleylpyruvate isomerase family mycothiol-dependent enzyme [Streptomyces sp. NBC_01187]
MAYAFDHDRYCTELARQAALFEDALAAAGPAGLDRRVPTCPDWTLRDLTVHLGGAYRWFAEIVRTRATEIVPDEAVPGVAGPGGAAGPAELREWFTEGAGLAVDELRAAGPDAHTWSWSTEQNPAFWARRATHETVVHRADACLAAGVDFTVAPEIAADCVDEWLDILTTPAVRARMTSLRLLEPRAGARLHLHATDVTADPDPAEWLIELTDEGVSWSRTHAKAEVALRGPLADVLLVFYRRLPADSPRVEVLGDHELLDLWLEATSFG